MSKIGLSLKIDVTKMDKTKFYKGEKGTYAELNIFVDLDNQDQYGNNGMVTQSWQGAEKGQTPILGNGKIFWKDYGQQRPQQQSQPQQAPASGSDDDLPF